MITIFILHSGQPGADPEKTLASFGNFVLSSHKVVNNSEINWFVNKNKIYSEWYCVLYDCEYIDEPLAAALPVFVEQCNARGGTWKETISFYKKEGTNKFEICPRMFKAYIQLPEAGLLNEGFSKESNTTCLNGWIRRLSTAQA